MAILNNNPLIGSGGNQGYNINNSLRFRSSASAYLSRTPASAGSQTTWTWSGWVKLGALTGNKGLFERFVSGTEFHTLAFRNSNEIMFYSYINPTDYGIATTAVFRDPSAWYHVVATFDTTNATAADRMRLYVNGNRITAFTDYGLPPQNYVGGWNGATLQSIGRYQDAAEFADNYLAEINFIDGQALTPSSFGETDTTTGVWKPKAYTGTYGTNGFYLKFSDIATTSGSNAGLGKDFSGNSNYWTTNNISVTSGVTYDAMTDSPTNTSATVANYCVLNPLLSTSYQTLSNANLTSTNNTSADNGNTYSSIPTGFSGKWYCEFKTINASSGYPTVGTRDVAITTRPINGAYGSIGGDPIGGSSGSVGYRANGDKSINGNATAYGSSYTDSDTIGIAVDADNGAIYFSKNGTWQNSGDPTSGATKTGAANTWTGGSQSFYIGASIYPSGNGVHFNFGQRPFTYTPPTGFVALNTFNLPDSTIKKGNSYMDATTYTGTGSSLAVTNAGAFKPDFLWVKDRSRLANHILVDSVRGVNNLLRSESTAAEAAGSFISSLNSNGFTLSANTISDSYYTNVSGDTFVGWQWQAGQGSTSSNTSGSITSTVSVNTTAGFSVVTYTGTGANATVGHGLGVAPKLIIEKVRTVGTGWCVYHTSLGATQLMELNTTGTPFTSSTYWQNTSPTPSVFSIGTYGGVNTNGGTHVAYCWAEIAGFSKFTSYTGNGSSDGPFVYLGFRPKFIMIKSSAGVADDWSITDTSRSTYNLSAARLSPNRDIAEDTNVGVGRVNLDILSNGFKLRQSSDIANGNGFTYIVAAWAENPFKNSLAR